MKVEINGNEYNLNFGIGFLREMDERFYQSYNGIKYGVALEAKLPSLVTGSLVALSEIIYSGTHAEEKRPTQSEVDQHIESLEDVGALLDGVIEELKKSSVTKTKTEMYIAGAKAAETLTLTEATKATIKSPRKQPTKKS